MRQLALAFGSGLVFALALGLGGMTLPERVLGFLDFTGAWDPTLLFFMGGAVGVFALAYRLRLRRQSPLLAPSFVPEPEGRLDARLVGGSALFGLGWGLAGYCPAPALASVGTGAAQVVVFAAAMVGGMTLYSALASALERRTAEEADETATVSAATALPAGSPTRRPDALEETCG
jgi:uncharacterized protein